MQGSIRQRSPGSWEITVDIGRDEFGKRQRRFRTVRGTKAQARRELRKLLAALDQGMTPPDERILVRDWLDRWMQEVVIPHRRQRTKERYEEIIAKHIAPAIGHIPLVKLGPNHIQALESTISARGGVVDPVHTVLSGALKYAMRMELVHRNPVALVTPLRKERRPVAPPDIATVKALLELARRERPDLFACIHLIAYTGLRRGEALGLLWPDVDLERGCLYIEGSLVVSSERGLILEPPKTQSGRRQVDLDARPSKC